MAFNISPHTGGRKRREGWNGGWEAMCEHVSM